MGWKEALLEYRAADNFQGVALLSQDRTLLRLTAAWPMVTRKLPPLPEREEDIDLATLWEQTKIDFQEWASLAQVKSLAVMQGFKVLKGNKIILPDGTLNHLAENLLQKEAAGKLLAEFGVKPGEFKR